MADMNPMNPMGLPFPPGFDLSQLFSGSAGPVNWDIARFVAQAMAGDAEGPSRWNDVESEYNDLVRAAEVQVTQYCELSAPDLLTPVEVVSRAYWAERHVEAFRPLVEPLAVKIAEAQAESAQASGGGAPFANLLRTLTPFLVGAQTGMLVGYLSHHVLGRYDLQLPPASGTKLMFVAANLEEAERTLNVVPRDFKFYIALREAVRAIEYGQPGIREEFTRLAGDLVETLSVDSQKFADLGGIDMNDMESMQSLFEDPSGLLSGLSSTEQNEATQRMEAFAGLVEGYAGHVLQGVGAERIPRVREIGAAVDEHASSERHDVEDTFQQLLGFGMRRSEYSAGRVFCDHVAAQEGIQALNRVWQDSASRPTLGELQNPDEWIARTIGRRG